MNLNLSLPARIGLNLVALLGGIAVLRFGSAIFLPLIYAILLATILWPSTNRLHSHYRLPWPLACTVSVGALIFFNLVVVAGFLLAIPRLFISVPNPNNPEAQVAFYDKFREQVIRISPVPVTDDYLPEKADQSPLFLTIKKAFEAESLLKYLGEAVNYFSAYMWQFILVLFILLFVLMEGRMLTRRIVEIFGPSSQVQSKVVSALASMSKVVRDFLVWRTVINIALAIVIGTVYQMLGLRQGWVWGMVTGVLCYIPYIGPIIAAGPPLLDALIHCGPWTALVVLVFYTGIIILEGYVIVPLLMGRQMDLNATTVMLACLFWELVWGVPGLFLAMPLMGAIKSVCEHVPGWGPWANLMSAQEVVRVQAVPVIDDPNKTVIMEVPVGTDGRGK